MEKVEKNEELESLKKEIELIKEQNKKLTETVNKTTASAGEVLNSYNTLKEQNEKLVNHFLTEKVTVEKKEEETFNPLTGEWEKEK